MFWIGLGVLLIIIGIGWMPLLLDTGAHVGGWDALIWAQLGIPFLKPTRFEFRIQLLGAQPRIEYRRFQKNWAPLPKTKGGFSSIKRGKRTWQYLLKRMHLDRLDVTARIGLEDAAYTALLCGGMDSILHTIRARVGSTLHWQIVPDFSHLALDVESLCIADLRVGHVIIAGAMALYDYAKGAIQAWKSTRLKTSCAQRWKTSGI